MYHSLAMPFRCGIMYCDIVISFCIILLYFYRGQSIICQSYHLEDTMITLTCASLLFFLRVVSKNVPIFRPDDGNVAESLSRFNSTFSLKNNTTWHVTDHFYTHNVNDHVNHPINQSSHFLHGLSQIWNESLKSDLQRGLHWLLTWGPSSIH